MKIGINLPLMAPGLDRDKTLAWCREIDAGPWSHLAIGERINFLNLDAMVAMSAAAVVTERVRLLSYVLILPNRSTVARAKEIASVDVLSGGRLSLGVGAGAREEDYLALDKPFGKRRVSELGEQVASMRRIWNGEKVVEDALLPVGPLPVQEGGPEVLVASLTEPAIRLVSRWADGIAGFSFGPSVDEITTCFDRARAAWREAERDASPKLIASFWFALGPNGRAQLDDYLTRYLNFFGPDQAPKLAQAVRSDSAQALADMVRRIEDTGADELSLVPTTADPDELSRVRDALGL